MWYNHWFCGTLMCKWWPQLWSCDNGGHLLLGLVSLLVCWWSWSGLPLRTVSLPQQAISIIHNDNSLVAIGGVLTYRSMSWLNPLYWNHWSYMIIIVKELIISILSKINNKLGGEHSPLRWTFPLSYCWSSSMIPFCPMMQTQWVLWLYIIIITIKSYLHVGELLDCDQSQVQGGLSVQSHHDKAGS